MKMTVARLKAPLSAMGNIHQIFFFSISINFIPEENRNREKMFPYGHELW